MSLQRLTTTSAKTEASRRLVDVRIRRQDGNANNSDVEFAIRQCLRAKMNIDAIAELSGFSRREVLAQRGKM